jgi:hypothetical protein
MTMPIVLDTILNNDDYLNLVSSIKNPKSFEYDSGFSRYYVGDAGLPILKEISNKLIPEARRIFNSPTLIPTYTLFVHYEGQDPIPSLYKHKDDNACTYTIDMCVYQNEPWDLWVDGKNYTLSPNQALAYYGNEQLHWREGFPNPETNHVAMIFFHFAEPYHWYFVKGPEYINVIRGTMSEEQWNMQNAR